MSRELYQAIQEKRLALAATEAATETETELDPQLLTLQKDLAYPIVGQIKSLIEQRQTKKSDGCRFLVNANMFIKNLGEQIQALPTETNAAGFMNSFLQDLQANHSDQLGFFLFIDDEGSFRISFKVKENKLVQSFIYIRETEVGAWLEFNYIDDEPHIEKYLCENNLNAEDYLMAYDVLVQAIVQTPTL